MVKDGDAARKKAADCMTRPLKPRLMSAVTSLERWHAVGRRSQIKWTDLKRLMSGSESINAWKQGAQRTRDVSANVSDSASLPNETLFSAEKPEFRT